MSSVNSLVLVLYLVPLMFAGVALLARHEPGPQPTRILRAARVVTWVAFVASLAASAVIVFWGPLVSPLLGIGDVGFSLRLDALSMVMFWLVAAIGILIVQFSRNYLDGDARHGAFIGNICLTIGAVIMLVLAGNLGQLIAAWIGTSLALHRLLIFYADRPGAVNAARKKFVVARTSDVSLVIAAVLIVRAFGVGDLGALADAAAQARAADVLPPGVGLAAMLIVIAAALKSAMFPFHGWLMEVMETPTPVSALLHAGLLNAGTFLVVRVGETVILVPAALQMLMIIGGVTALFASVAMVMQSSVKVSLAYSSAAHMGFMLLLCGLGAHSVAIMHLIAHSFYKAHAFLSAGSVVEYTAGLGPKKVQSAPRPFGLLISLASALAIFVSIGTVLGIDLTKRPGEMALGAIFVMAITYLLVQAYGTRPGRYVVMRTTLAASAVTLSFFALELAAAWILGGAVAAFPQPDVATTATMVVVVVAFGLVMFLQTLLPAMAHSPAWRAAYVHLKHGLYANTLFDRLIGAWR